MLVLSRRQGERIQIGKDVVVVVLEAKRGRIRLGIEAPRQIAVQRQEIAVKSPVDESAACLTGIP